MKTSNESTEESVKDNSQNEAQGKERKRDRSFYIKGLIVYIVFALVGVALCFADLPFLGVLIVLLGCLGAMCMFYGILNPNWEAKASNSKQTASKPAKTAKPTYSTAASYTEEYVLKDKGEDIIRNAPAPDENFGFANMPIFVVSGKKKSTNRKNTRTIFAVDEAGARAYAIKHEGLMEPLEVSYAQFEPAPSENEFNLPLPKGATRYDLFAFENSCIARDTTHIPPEFMEYAVNMGVGLSWLHGRNAAARYVFERIDDREKAMLYGYAVHCEMRGITPGNIDKSVDLPLYTKFADEACRDAKVWSSISKRPGDDIWSPSKSTNAYKYACSFFSQAQPQERSSPKQAKPPQTQVPARVGYRPAPDKMKISAAEYIVIDVETTGLSPDDDRIIEVAAVKCENDRIVDSFHSLINPGRRIPSNVTKLTGIKNADVAGAPDMDTVAPELSEFIDNLPLVAHNANFDIKFIANAFKRAGVSKGMLYIDTLVLARNAFPDMPNHKLSTLINELGLLDHEQEHRAMSDVEATQRLYMACKAQLVRQ